MTLQTSAALIRALLEREQLALWQLPKHNTDDAPWIEKTRARLKANIARWRNMLELREQLERLRGA